MGDGTCLLLLAQNHLWVGASHGHPDVSGPQAPEHRCLVLLVSSRPALHAIIYSRQLAHAEIPAIPEERAVPVVAYSLASSQCPPCAVLILVFLRFVSAAQLVLVLLLFQKPIRSWKLIADEIGRAHV